MDKQDFYAANSALHARIIQKAKPLAPQPWVNSKTGEVTYRGPERESLYYDRVVAALQALAAEILTWEV